MKKLILTFSIILGLTLTAQAQENTQNSTDKTGTESTETVKKSCATKKSCKTVDKKTCKTEAKAEKSCKTSKKTCCLTDKAEAPTETAMNTQDNSTKDNCKKTCNTEKKDCKNKQSTCKTKTVNSKSNM